MNKKILLVMLIALLTVGVFLGCGGNNTSNNSNSAPNNTSNTAKNSNLAPDFSWRDSSGKIMHLSDLRGRIVMLDFWATWCGPCKMTIPHVEALYEKYKDKGVVVIGVDLDTAAHRNDVINFIKSHNMHYLVISDAKGGVASQYGATSIPRFFIIDKKGGIAFTKIGYDPNMEKIISDEIDKLLSQ